MLANVKGDKMNTKQINQIETARARLHNHIDEVFASLLKAKGAEPKSLDNSKYNLVITIEGGLAIDVPDEWVESFASGEFKDQGIDWVLKYMKDCGEATALNVKYQGKAGGARARLRNWMKHKIEWAGPQATPKMVGGKYERNNA